MIGNLRPLARGSRIQKRLHHLAYTGCEERTTLGSETFTTTRGLHRLPEFLPRMARIARMGKMNPKHPRCFSVPQPRAAWQSSFSTAGHVSPSVKSVKSVVMLNRASLGELVTTVHRVNNTEKNRAPTLEPGSTSSKCPPTFVGIRPRSVNSAPSAGEESTLKCTLLA